MKYRNNLTEFSGNCWLEVVEPFDVYLTVGHYPSNSSYGSSTLYGTVHVVRTLEPGDQIWDLYGGVFAVIDGVRYKADFTLSEKHPFEKEYLREPDEWPVEKLRLIPVGDYDTAAAHYKIQMLTAEEVYAKGRPIGRSIKFVIPEI